MPASRLNEDQTSAESGARIAFNHDKQAWFPVNGHVPVGAVLATLKSDCIYDKKVGMRSRAIQFEFEHGESDDSPPRQDEVDEPTSLDDE